MYRNGLLSVAASFHNSVWTFCSWQGGGAYVCSCSHTLSLLREDSHMLSWSPATGHTTCVMVQYWAVSRWKCVCVSVCLFRINSKHHLSHSLALHPMIEGSIDSFIWCVIFVLCSLPVLIKCFVTPSKMYHRNLWLLTEPALHGRCATHISNRASKLKIKFWGGALIGIYLCK